MVYMGACTGPDACEKRSRSRNSAGQAASHRHRGVIRRPSPRTRSRRHAHRTDRPARRRHRQPGHHPGFGRTSANGTIVQEQAPGLPPVDASQNARGTNNREVFRVLGFSGEIAAPVTPAYNDQATYRTFAGQPGNGANAVLAQTIDGAP